MKIRGAFFLILSFLWTGAEEAAALKGKNPSLIEDPDQWNGFEEFSSIMSHVLVRENQQVPKQVKDFSDFLNDLLLLMAMMDSTKTDAEKAGVSLRSVSTQTPQKTPEGKGLSPENENKKDNTPLEDPKNLESNVPEKKSAAQKEKPLENAQEKDTAACQEAFKSFQAALEKAKEDFKGLIRGVEQIERLEEIQILQKDTIKILDDFSSNTKQALEEKLKECPKEAEQWPAARQGLQNFAEEMSQQVKSLHEKIIAHNDKVNKQKAEEEQLFKERKTPSLITIEY